MSTSAPTPPIIDHPSPSPSASVNPFAALVPAQKIAVLSSFTLESGVELRQVEVGYRTWGKLNGACDNVMVICHALTGSSDVEDWCALRLYILSLSSSSKHPFFRISRWGPMLGPGLAFDPSRYFIFCANVLASPYGTASPVTRNPDTGKRWGPEFPQTTIRDNVRYVFFLLSF
jgi:homoserine O-acetyltransferase